MMFGRDLPPVCYKVEHLIIKTCQTSVSSFSCHDFKIAIRGSTVEKQDVSGSIPGSCTGNEKRLSGVGRVK